MAQSSPIHVSPRCLTCDLLYHRLEWSDCSHVLLGCENRLRELSRDGGQRLADLADIVCGDLHEQCTNLIDEFTGITNIIRRCGGSEFEGQQLGVCDAVLNRIQHHLVQDAIDRT